MKRITVVLMAAVLLAAFAGTAGAQITETDLFGIEIGQITGYDFDADDIVTSSLLGLHFGMSDSLELGFVFLDGDMTMDDFSLVRMTWFVQEEFGFHLSTGSAGGNAAGGIGVFTSPIRREFDDRLTTSLRISLDYLNPDFEQTAATEGTLGLGISGKIAF